MSATISKTQLILYRTPSINTTNKICKNISITIVTKPYYNCSLVPNYNYSKTLTIMRSYYKFITNNRRLFLCNNKTGLSNMSSLPDHHHSLSNTKTVRVVVKGKVQGVFYRNWSIENANELGLKGWVRNRRDGSVEALFSGSPDKVRQMEQRCRRGPPAAIVTNIEVSPCDDDPGTGFERKQTI